MTTDYSPQSHKLIPKQYQSGTLTMDWFAQKALYPPRAGAEVTPLINGEAAFAAVYDAIQSAQKSVDIISWGFDPAMRFKPGSDRIGELLDLRARFGVNVRVLIWKNPLANIMENTVIGDGLMGSGGTAAGSGVTSGKPAKQPEEITQLQLQRQHNQATIDRLYTTLENSRQRRQQGDLSNYDSAMERDTQGRIAQLEAENRAIDKRIEEVTEATTGYGGMSGSGAPKLDPQDQEFTRNWFRRVHKGWMQNVEFRTRDFKTVGALYPVFGGLTFLAESDRFKMLTRLLSGEAPDLNYKQILALTFFASHHQKMVLVDYEDHANAVGFVMGHNMHRNYWDTNAHLFDDRAARRSPGFGPWQDISTMVRGPVLHDLNDNFSNAWDRETFWIKRWFTDGLKKQRQGTKPDAFEPRGANIAQIIRTQPQENDETSILEAYRKAIGNARNYIYMENQYFRYPDFARQLRTLAAAYKERGRKDDLYLFVATNNPNGSFYSSSTYSMMQELGQEQLMPQAQRDLAEKLIRKRRRLAAIQADTSGRSDEQARIPQLESEIAELEAQGITPEVEERLGGLQKADIPELAKPKEGEDEDMKPYELEELPGLKVVIGTLTACSPEPGSPLPQGQQARFRDIYIHSKLLVVDDVFSLVSSANINARSMHTDSELGVCSPNPELARHFREELWKRHARETLNDPHGQCDAKLNFNNWNRVMNKNWKNRASNQPLIAHLTRFWDVETPYATAAD
jgi:phosphatidylserine/phosphatidylglycerophosphate/cardiolipin synthase-like enzyme